MCNDRVTRGRKPVCVQVCPTCAMTFVDRPSILELARKRLEQVKIKSPEAHLVDPDQVNVIFLLTEKAEHYPGLSASRVAPGLSRQQFLTRLLRPMGRALKTFSS